MKNLNLVFAKQFWLLRLSFSTYCTLSLWNHSSFIWIEWLNGETLVERGWRWWWCWWWLFSFRSFLSVASFLNYWIYNNNDVVLCSTSLYDVTIFGRVFFVHKVNAIRIFFQHIILPRKPSYYPKMHIQNVYVFLPVKHFGSSSKKLEIASSNVQN